MAPRKRKVEGGGDENGKSKTAALSTRVTRSMAHGGSSGPAAVAKVASKKQTGKATKKNKAKETNKAAEEEEEPDAEVGPTQDEEEKDEVEHEEEEKKTVVVEHCKQCNSFKTRALQVKGGLEKAVPGVNVLLNPDKPRRGCFEIREKGGEKFISLLDMKRPFKQMKDLDMEEVIAEIVDKIKA